MRIIMRTRGNKFNHNNTSLIRKLVRGDLMRGSINIRKFPTFIRLVFLKLLEIASLNYYVYFTV